MPQWGVGTSSDHSHISEIFGHSPSLFWSIPVVSIEVLSTHFQCSTSKANSHWTVRLAHKMWLQQKHTNLWFLSERWIAWDGAPSQIPQQSGLSRCNKNCNYMLTLYLKHPFTFWMILTKQSWVLLRQHTLKLVYNV